MSYLLISAQQFKPFGCFCGILKIIPHLKKSRLWINIVSTHCDVKVKWNSYINHWNKWYPTQMVNTVHRGSLVFKPAVSSYFKSALTEESKQRQRRHCSGQRGQGAHSRHLQIIRSICLHASCYFAVSSRMWWLLGGVREKKVDHRQKQKRMMRCYQTVFDVLFPPVSVQDLRENVNLKTECSIDSNKLWNNMHDDWKSLCTQRYPIISSNYISHDSCCLL